MASDHPSDPAAPLPPPPPDAGQAPAERPAPVPAPPPPPPPPSAPDLGGIAPGDDSPTITDWTPPATKPLPTPAQGPDAVPAGWGAPSPGPTSAATGWGSPEPSASRGRSAAPFIVVGLVALGLVAGGIGFAALGSASPTPAPSVAAVATASPTATPDVAATPEPTTAPTPEPTTEPSDAPVPDASVDPDASPVFGSAEDVAALRGLVPEEIRDGCTSAEIYGNQVAALRCDVTGAASLYYELYPDRKRLDASWQAMLDNNGLTEGSGACGSGEAGETGWYYEGNEAGKDEGRDACYVEDDGTATFLWTDFTTLTRGWLFGNEGDSIKDVYDRWNQGDLDPVR